MKKRSLALLTLWLALLGQGFVFAQSPLKIGAEEEHFRVDSPNFTVTGNAGEAAIRRNAFKFERFREVFRRLFPDKSFVSTVPVKVIVFKSAASFRPFKPLRASGQIDEGVAGYFQTGSDANYILLNAGESYKDNSDTALHEYVHHLADREFGTANIPLWLNEGLATYYQTFRLEKERFAVLGEPPPEYRGIFRRQKMLPLRELIKLDKQNFHSHEDAPRSVLYAQSWALVHYLLHLEKERNPFRFNKYLEILRREPDSEKAFELAFGIAPDKLETVFQTYATSENFQTRKIDLGEKVLNSGNLSVTKIGKAEFEAHLGEVLFFSGREREAEKILLAALRREPSLSIANSTLGLLKMRQKNFSEAEKYLQKAVADEKAEFSAFYRYAYFLSRENVGEDGKIFGYAPEKAATMRELLRRTIKLSPHFAAAYELLAFVNLLQNEDLDEAVQLLKKAIALAPQNYSHRFYLASVYLRKEDFVTARLITQNLLARNHNAEFRHKLEILRQNIEKTEKNYDEEERIIARKRLDPILSLTDETTVSIILRRESMRVLRQSLRRPNLDEEQTFGVLQEIDCTRKGIIFKVKGENGELKFRNLSFKDIEITFFANSGKTVKIGCGKPDEELHSVVTFRPNFDEKADFKGEVVSIEIVPSDFKLED